MAPATQCDHARTGACQVCGHDEPVVLHLDESQFETYVPDWDDVQARSLAGRGWRIAGRGDNGARWAPPSRGCEKTGCARCGRM